MRNDELDVIGLEVQVGRRTELFGARRGIIFCSGGFLHNKRLALEFLRGPVLGGAAAEGSRGDFVDIGIEVGAQLGNMSHAWWDQVVAELAVRVPETVRDVYEPFGDSMVIVDRRGQRVVNEKIPYNERAQVHFAWDPVRREYPNLLLFMVWDEAVATNPDPTRFRFPVPPPGERYDFVDHRADVRGARRRAGAATREAGAVDGRLPARPQSFAAGLAATVERFDAMADDGRDLDFHRGETPIEEVWAGAPRPGATTAALHRFAPEGPYHCVILGAGALDTKGGPVIDTSARVLAPSGEPIVGLYGAGNCIASPAGQAYWGAGRHHRAGPHVRLHRRPRGRGRAHPLSRLTGDPARPWTPWTSSRSTSSSTSTATSSTPRSGIDSTSCSCPMPCSTTPAFGPRHRCTGWRRSRTTSARPTIRRPTT